MRRRGHAGLIVRCLIGGVGYPDLSDHSASWEVVRALEWRVRPAGILVEDVSYNPVAVAQRLEDEPADARFDTVVFVSAVTRGREAGAITAYRWDGCLPAPEAIQQAVTDAVTGIIFLDHTLVVTRHLGALPVRVAVLEVEPLVEAFGAPMSAAVEHAVPRLCDLALEIATTAAAFARLPEAPLGGPVVEARRG